MRSFRSLAAVLLLALAPGMAGCGGLRVFFPSHETDSVPPELPAELGRPAFLVFSKTNGFRHEEAIPAGIERFRAIADAHGWSVVFTENGAVHNPQQLARFDAVVWHNVSGDVLDDAQQQALVDYIEGGGGFVGVHGSGGDPFYDWKWYVEELIGAQFISHTMGPQFQEATVIVETPEHPATRGLPPTFRHTEEWYSFDRDVRDRPGFRVLATVDEATYSPHMKMLFMDDDIAMGDHPVVWSHCVGEGRVLYSALGHRAEAYAEPEIASLLDGAVAWAARQAGEGCDANADAP